MVSATLHVKTQTVSPSPVPCQVQVWQWWVTPPVPLTGSPYHVPPPALLATVNRLLGLSLTHVLRGCVVTYNGFFSGFQGKQTQSLEVLSRLDARLIAG